MSSFENSKIAGKSLKIEIAGFWKSFKFQLNITSKKLSGKILFL